MCNVASKDVKDMTQSWVATLLSLGALLADLARPVDLLYYTWHHYQTHKDCRAT